MNFRIKDIVKNYRKASFSRFRAGNFYYIVQVLEPRLPHTVNTYEFPVPLDDIGNATLNNEEKTIFLMRWIRKALDEGTFIRK